MITSLKYKVTFPQTGRTLARDVKFDAGMTAITGPNEAGKSYVIEMIRFCFFGTAALRGAADDYKTLEAEMSWTCKGKVYRVTRKINNAKVYEDGEAIAVGVKPVNAKILSVLGFGLDVFDIACVTNQGEVERLGNMKPAERKRMVDEVIGVDRIDEVTKWCAEQGTFLNREIAMLDLALVEPVVPVQPADYEPSEVIKVAFETNKLLWDERNQIEGWLSQTRIEPVEPVDPGGHPISVLEEQLGLHREWLAETARIGNMPIVDYDVEALRGSWTAFDLWSARVAFEKAHPRCTWTNEDLLDAEKQLNLYERWLPLDAQLKQLEAGQATKCPHCHEQFLLAHEAVEYVRQETQALGPIVIPCIDRAELRQQAHRQHDWMNRDTLARWEELKDAPEAPAPTLPRTKLVVPPNAVTTAQKAAMLRPDPVEDHKRIEALIAARKVYDVNLAVFQRESAAYITWRSEADVKQARYDALNGIGSIMAALQSRSHAALTYERDLEAYTAGKVAYDEQKVVLDAKRVEAAGWKNARAFLAELRTRIKTYLVPSLSKVASHLLAQMTGGQRSSIIVDEDFEVMVDGQKLGTLSGSGKACANLALRIGLGQVLTNNVLSLFIGDEVDASMDDDRADFTQGSLQSLVVRISQILLITHKVPTADHVVTFEGDDGQRSNTLCIAG